MTRCVVLADICAARYKTLLFRELNAVLPRLKVVYIAPNERGREWIVDPSEMTFPHEVLFGGHVDDAPPVPLFLKAWRRLAALDPECVIVDGYVHASCWAGLLWARARRRKAVLWSCSTVYDHPRALHTEVVKSAFVRACDAYHVYCERSKSYLVGLGAPERAVAIVGNCTDGDFYRDETRRWRAQRDSVRRELGLAERNFLFIGRLHPEKNVFKMLEAYGGLDGSVRRRWGLVLVGDGPQREEVARVAARIPGVVLAGPRRPDEIPRFMAVSDALVLPSVTDRWGLVVNEAMAAGMPVFVSRHCGCWPELVREGVNGFTFDPHEPAHLRALLASAAGEELDLEALGAASQRLIAGYTPRSTAEKIARALSALGA